jgi:tRNA U54 and U55 pseudouridine synthase Pus10
MEETERNLRKLEEENRMLGGRVIVLEAKDVTLRNRAGDELEERVEEFTTRVGMLLSDR